MDAGIRGERFLITGASGGIGRALAHAFAAEDAEVVAHYHRNRDAAERLASELPTGAILAQADLTREPDVDALFATALQDGASLRGVVVNAGIWEEAEAPLATMTLEQWNRTITADLTSAFLTCRGFLRHVADQRPPSASIVFIGSTAGRFGEENHADYSSAKAALARGLTPSLKNEIVRLSPGGRVNCVDPGWVRTPMAESALANPGLVGRVVATVAMRKIATPEDVARAALFLSSDRLAGHISGAVVPVDGGMEGRWLHP